MSTTHSADRTSAPAWAVVAAGRPERRRDAVVKLTLTDFRSYRGQRLLVDDRPVVLTGPNGAGKTNLLEAISMLAPGRGLRRSRLGELGRNGAEGPWAVAAKAIGRGGPHDIGTGLARGAANAAGPTDADDGDHTDERRVVKIDGRPARGASALAEVLAMRWLTPQMDRLLVDAAAPRRRFLDRLVFGFDPSHARRVNEYQRALRQRARLLREVARDAAWIAAAEETMSATGVAIAVARRDATARLANALSLATGPFPRAAVALDGAIESWLGESSALDAEVRFRTALQASRERDAAAGGAAVGPHRSDLVVSHGDNGLAATHCSTGEQKALLISVLLADARLHAARRGSAPLLLLDEIGAHLDAVRREALFAELLDLGVQAWLTGTDRRLFAPLGERAQWLVVEDSQISPELGARP